MSAMTPAVAAAQRAGIEHRVHRYRADPRAASYGDDAVAHLATASGVVPGQILKTLVVTISGHPGPGRPVSRQAIAVLPVPQRLSLRAMAAALSVSRVEMADPAVAQRVTGYVLGGVSPLGQRSALPTVIDSSATAWPTVLCSAGRRGLEIELSPTDLVHLTGAITAAISS